MRSGMSAPGNLRISIRCDRNAGKALQLANIQPGGGIPKFYRNLRVLFTGSDLAASIRLAFRSFSDSTSLVLYASFALLVSGRKSAPAEQAPVQSAAKNFPKDSFKPAVPN